MKRVLIICVLLLALSTFSHADSSLVLEDIPTPGPQTGQRFQTNFLAIKEWTDKVDADGNDVPDTAETATTAGSATLATSSLLTQSFGFVPTICPAGTYATGIAANGNATGCAYYAPVQPLDWDPGEALPDTLVEAIDDLAEDKVAVYDTVTVTEGLSPVGILDCQGPQCVHLGTTDKCLWYSVVLGVNGWVEDCVTTIGVQPAATCRPGMLHIDTDETDDDVCATTADNSLCLCIATNTWTALENN